jgi:hypothetical protein
VFVEFASGAVVTLEVFESEACKSDRWGEWNGIRGEEPRSTDDGREWKKQTRDDASTKTRNPFGKKKAGGRCHAARNIEARRNKPNVSVMSVVQEVFNVTFMMNGWGKSACNTLRCETHSSFECACFFKREGGGLRQKRCRHSLVGHMSHKCGHMSQTFKFFCQQSPTNP